MKRSTDSRACSRSVLGRNRLAPASPGADNSERPFNHSSGIPLSRSPPNPSRPTPSFSRRKSRLSLIAGLLHPHGFEPVIGRDQCPCTDNTRSPRRLRTFPNLHSLQGFAPRRSKRSIRSFAKGPLRSASLSFGPFGTGPRQNSCAADRSMNPGTVLIILPTLGHRQTKKARFHRSFLSFFVVWIGQFGRRRQWIHCV